MSTDTEEGRQVVEAFLTAVQRLEEQARRWGLCEEANGLRNYRAAVQYRHRAGATEREQKAAKGV